MYAIIKTGGKQYKVKAGDLVEIEMLENEVGEKVKFDEVLAIGKTGGELKVGAPTVEGVSVEGEIVDQFRDKKLIAFKMKRRKSYRRTVGHRQYKTRVKIGEING